MFDQPRGFVWVFVGVAVGILLVGQGCRPSSPSPSPQAESAPLAPQVQGASPSEEITLRVIDENDFAQILAQKRGSVVLVDCWATWCPACLELFPHTLELAEKWKDRGLVVISLSFDDPDDYDRVLERLKRFGARIENYLVKYGASQKSVEAFDITHGALPHYKLYDRDGNLYKVLASGGRAIKPETIDEAVEELLSK